MKLVLKSNEKKVYTGWEMPSYNSEKGEFDRYNFSSEEIENIKNSFNSNNVQTLSNSIWKKLNNTDSWNIQSLDDSYRLCQEYEKSCEFIMDSYKNNTALDYPIIIKKQNNYELVAGNTRLMFAKALNITPKVLIINLGE